MHDDVQVLKQMGLLLGNRYEYNVWFMKVIVQVFLGLDKGTCRYEDIEKAKTLVPPRFGKYIEGMFCVYGMYTQKIYSTCSMCLWLLYNYFFSHSPQ